MLWRLLALVSILTVAPQPRSIRAKACQEGCSSFRCSLSSDFRMPLIHQLVGFDHLLANLLCRLGWVQLLYGQIWSARKRNPKDVWFLLIEKAIITSNSFMTETSALVVGELRHEQHHALQSRSSGVFAGPRSSIASARRKPMAPKKKSEGPKVTKPPATERYDYSRTVGAPCFGHHQLEPPGREVAAATTISPSGSHAKCANSGWLHWRQGRQGSRRRQRKITKPRWLQWATGRRIGLRSTDAWSSRTWHYEVGSDGCRPCFTYITAELTYIGISGKGPWRLGSWALWGGKAWHVARWIWHQSMS